MSAVVISRIVRELKAKPGALLPILHGIQEELGYIPEDAVPIIASEMNLTRAEVHGVVTFYHDFRSHPPGRHIVQNLPGRILSGGRKRGTHGTRQEAYGH